MSKERLVELLQKRSCWHNKCESRCAECDCFRLRDSDIDKVADHLLANGVIVPNENEALLPVTEKELLHMLNDIIAYCQMLEERGCNLDNTFGYFSRRELYKKLGAFEREHFNRYTECPAREEAEAKLKESESK